MFILLTVFCSAAYVAKVSQEEVVQIFAIIVALVTLIASIIFSPWFVQIAILICALSWQSPFRSIRASTLSVIKPLEK